MSYRRILVVLLLGSLFSFSHARETEPVSNVDDVQMNVAGGDYYSVTPEQTEKGLLYRFYDHIVVHSGLDTSRRIILKDVPFAGNYKIDVVAMYTKDDGSIQENEEYRLLIQTPNGVVSGAIIPDQNSPITDSTDVVDEDEDYQWIRNQHGFHHLQQGDNVIMFATGTQFLNGGKHNSVDFASIRIVPPPHIVDEPPFTAGSSNTIEWQPIESGALTQDVYYFDTSSSLAKMAPNRAKSESSTQSTRSAVFEGLADGRRYGYYVEALLQSGQTIRSDTTFSTQDASPPTRVNIDTSLYSYFNQFVEIYWNAAQDDISGVDYYQIVRTEKISGMSISDTTVIPSSMLCATDALFDYCYTDTISEVAEPHKVFTYRVDAVDNVGNVSTGKESQVVMQVPTPQLTSAPEPVSGRYYKGASITLNADLSRLTQPEFHKIHFQAVRDNAALFDSELGPDKYFFDSGWLDIAAASKTSLYTFDLTDGGANDLNFINNHSYYIRVQLKDIQNNFSAWSDVFEIVPDCFMPSDITFLTAHPSTNPENTDGWVDLKWGGATDHVSGIDSFYVYRKTPAGGEFEFVDKVQGDTYRDSFDDIDWNGQVFYRIGSEDKVGNIRGIGGDSTKFEVLARSQAAPYFKIISLTHDDDGSTTKITTMPDILIECEFENFDDRDDVKLIPLVNEVEEDALRRVIGTDNLYTYTLPDSFGIYTFRVKALFPTKMVSLWSMPDSIEYVDDTQQKNNGIVKDQEPFAVANYPNPFNPSTSINYNLQFDAQVTVEVYNVQGRRIKLLTNAYHQKGMHSVVWNGDNESGTAASSGMYYYRVQIDSKDHKKINIVKRMLLLK